jgi:hypothetical protein
MDSLFNCYFDYTLESSSGKYLGMVSSRLTYGGTEKRLVDRIKGF